MSRKLFAFVLGSCLMGAASLPMVAQNTTATATQTAKPKVAKKHHRAVKKASKSAATAPAASAAPASK
jgi:hypothetical protein